MIFGELFDVFFADAVVADVGFVFLLIFLVLIVVVFSDVK